MSAPHWLDEFFGPAGPPLANEGTGTLNNITTHLDGMSPQAGVRFTGAAPSATGFAGGTSGRRLVVSTVGGPLVLKNESASSAAANRVLTGTGADMTIGEDGAAWLIYDSTSSRWRVAGGSGGGGGATIPGDLDEVLTSGGDGTAQATQYVKAGVDEYGGAYMALGATYGDAPTYGTFRTHAYGSWVARDLTDADVDVFSFAGISPTVRAFAIGGSPLYPDYAASSLRFCSSKEVLFQLATEDAWGNAGYGAELYEHTGTTTRFFVLDRGTNFVLNGDRYAVGTPAQALGSGMGVAHFGDCVTETSTAPVGGFVLQSKAGVPWVHESGGAKYPILTSVLPTVATANATPVYVTLATLAVGDVKQVDVIATVAKADGTVRQSFKLSALVYGAAGPTATLEGGSLTDAAPEGTGAAVVELHLTGATVRLKVTGIAATDLITTYDPSVV